MNLPSPQKKKTNLIGTMPQLIVVTFLQSMFLHACVNAVTFSMHCVNIIITFASNSNSSSIS